MLQCCRAYLRCKHGAMCRLLANGNRLGAACSFDADVSGGGGGGGSSGGGGGCGDGFPGGDSAPGWDARRIWTLIYAVSLIGGKQALQCSLSHSVCLDGLPEWACAVSPALAAISAHLCCGLSEAFAGWYM